jgi:hydrogenase expression/formation protein HypD
VKFFDEYRDQELAEKLSKQLAKITTRPWTIMEVCGGQTHTILQFGLEQLLPSDIELVHGPGCPICVTPIELIDRAIAIAGCADVIFCSFGDMLRVPGSQSDLLRAKAAGADVRIVYSPLDCLSIARNNPRLRVVFFAIGFETTAPANAMAVWQARRLELDNFFLLCSHVTVPPVMMAVLQSPDNRVQGFLGPGHVCSIMGYKEYQPISQSYKVPIVITGFEPIDLLEGILLCVTQLEQGCFNVENQYLRAVTEAGNISAQSLLREVFEVVDHNWRGIGIVPRSGYKLTKAFRQFDAESVFEMSAVIAEESPLCISGQILKGDKKPFQCPVFGTECTPEHPLGATMVSSEGTCASYYKFASQPATEDIYRRGKK